MATSGGISTSSGNSSYFRLEWTRASYSVAGNYSDINWTLYFYAGAYWYSNAVKVNSVYINGGGSVASGTWSNVSPPKGWKTLRSGSKRIYHASNGTCSFPITINGWLYDNNKTGSGTAYLDTLPIFSVTTSAGAGCAITKTISATYYKASPTISIKPPFYYRISAVHVDGVNKGAVSSVVVPIKSRNHSVAAYFAKQQYKITTFAGTGGTITPSFNVDFDGTGVVNITPDKYYLIDRVLVDGINKGAVSSISIPMNTKNHTVQAYFKKAIQARVGGVDVTEIKVGDKPVIGMMINGKIIF